MARRYDRGVIIGEVDPPVGTLEEWVCNEAENATMKLNAKIEGPLQASQNASLNGRIGALRDVLREIERRKI